MVNPIAVLNLALLLVVIGGLAYLDLKLATSRSRKPRVIRTQSLPAYWEDRS